MNRGLIARTEVSPFTSNRDEAQEIAHAINTQAAKTSQLVAAAADHYAPLSPAEEGDEGHADIVGMQNDSMRAQILLDPEESPGFEVVSGFSRLDEELSEGYDAARSDEQSQIIPVASAVDNGLTRRAAVAKTLAIARSAKVVAQEHGVSAADTIADNALYRGEVLPGVYGHNPAEAVDLSLARHENMSGGVSVFGLAGRLEAEGVSRNTLASSLIRDSEQGDFDGEYPLNDYIDFLQSEMAKELMDSGLGEIIESFFKEGVISALIAATEITSSLPEEKAASRDLLNSEFLAMHQRLNAQKTSSILRSEVRENPIHVLSRHTMARSMSLPEMQNVAGEIHVDMHTPGTPMNIVYDRMLALKV